MYRVPGGVLVKGFGYWVLGIGFYQLSGFSYQFLLFTSKNSSLLSLNSFWAFPFGFAQLHSHTIEYENRR